MSSIQKDSNYELSDETCELLDLYVVGALESEEVEKAELFIGQSDQARRYVDESMGMFADFENNEPASQFLLASIKSQIDRDSKNAKPSNVTNINSKRNFIVPFLTGAIAASFIAVMLSVTVWPQTSSSESNQFALDKEVGAFSSESGTQTVELTSEKGQLGAKVMIHEDGDIMIDCRQLAALDKNSTYQLWAIVDTAEGQKVISAGVLGSDPNVSMARVSGTIVAFSLTKEVSGGVDKSDQEALYSATIA